MTDFREANTCHTRTVLLYNFENPPKVERMSRQSVFLIPPTGRFDGARILRGEGRRGAALRQGRRPRPAPGAAALGIWEVGQLTLGAIWVRGLGLAK